MQYSFGPRRGLPGRPAPQRSGARSPGRSPQRSVPRGAPGALPSAASFRLLVAIRNRIAHSYPDDPERQAGNLNAAYEAVPDLLAAHEGVRRYLERRLLGG